MIFLLFFVVQIYYMNSAMLKILMSFGPKTASVAGALGQAIVNYHAPVNAPPPAPATASMAPAAMASAPGAAERLVGANYVAPVGPPMPAPSLAPPVVERSPEQIKFLRSQALFGIPDSTGDVFKPWAPSTLMSIPGGWEQLERGQQAIMTQ